MYYPFIADLFNFVSELHCAPVSPLLTEAGRGKWTPREEVFRMLKTLRPKERQVILPGLRNIAHRLGTDEPPRLMQVLPDLAIGRRLIFDDHGLADRIEAIAKPFGPMNQWIAALTYGLENDKLRTLAILLIIANAHPPYPWLDSRRFLRAVSETIGPRTLLPEQYREPVE